MNGYKKLPKVGAIMRVATINFFSLESIGCLRGCEFVLIVLVNYQ